MNLYIKLSIKFIDKKIVLNFLLIPPIIIWGFGVLIRLFRVKRELSNGILMWSNFKAIFANYNGAGGARSKRWRPLLKALCILELYFNVMKGEMLSFLGSILPISEGVGIIMAFW